MGDLSTREQIRAEAIERLAVGQFEIDERDFRSATLPARAWAAVPEQVRQRYRRDAEPLVDALGDLLPTGAEWGYHCGNCTDPDACDPSEPCTSSREKPVIEKIRSGCPMMRRYITDWIEVTE